MCGYSFFFFLSKSARYHPNNNRIGILIANIIVIENVIPSDKFNELKSYHWLEFPSSSFDKNINELIELVGAIIKAEDLYNLVSSMTSSEKLTEKIRDYSSEKSLPTGIFSIRTSYDSLSDQENSSLLNISLPSPIKQGEDPYGWINKFKSNHYRNSYNSNGIRYTNKKRTGSADTSKSRFGHCRQYLSMSGTGRNLSGLTIKGTV